MWQGREEERVIGMTDLRAHRGEGRLEASIEDIGARRRDEVGRTDGNIFEYNRYGVREVATTAMMIAMTWTRTSPSSYPRICGPKAIVISAR